MCKWEPTFEEIKQEFRRGYDGPLEYLGFEMFGNLRLPEFSLIPQGGQGFCISTNTDRLQFKGRGGIGTWQRAAFAVAFELGRAARAGKHGVQKDLMERAA